MTTIDELVTTSRTRRRLPDPTVRRLLRERAGLSQSEVARVLGVSESAVSRWEAGVRTPRNSLCAPYAELLDRLAREVFA